MRSARVTLCDPQKAWALSRWLLSPAEDVWIQQLAPLPISIRYLVRTWISFAYSQVLLFWRWLTDQLEHKDAFVISFHYAQGGGMWNMTYPR